MTAKPSVKPDGLQDELSRAAEKAPGLHEAPQLELQEASSWRPLAGDHVTTGDAEVLYDDVPAETGARTLDSDHSKSVRPRTSHCNNNVILTHRLVSPMVCPGS